MSPQFPRQPNNHIFLQSITMFQQRPSMHARDSSGKQVSLLNDEPSRSYNIQFANPDYSDYGSSGMVRSSSNTSAPSNISSPCTPGLMRADSYDSQNTSDSHSPITPTYLDDFGRQISYPSTVSYKDPTHYDHHDTMAYGYVQHSQYSIPGPASYVDSRNSSYAESQSYEEEQYMSGKGSKRYPCRFKESHGCDRTFTTSGHASRHSKIHTAEKAVQCTFAGCQKKFTRADNMKQHLETHFKDRSRSSTSTKLSSSKSSNLTFAAGVKKPVRAPSRASSRAESRPVQTSDSLPMDPALFEPYLPTAYQPLNMTSVQEALISQPMANGLDALATAAAQSQG